MVLPYYRSMIMQTEHSSPMATRTSADFWNALIY